MSGPFQFPVILVKLATPLLPPQTKLNFEQIGSNEGFFAHNIAGGSGGGRRDEPKRPNKKLSLGAESYVTITWKGFFTQLRFTNLFAQYFDYTKLVFIRD